MEDPTLSSMSDETEPGAAPPRRKPFSIDETSDPSSEALPRNTRDSPARKRSGTVRALGKSGPHPAKKKSGAFDSSASDPGDDAPPPPRARSRRPAPEPEPEPPEPAEAEQADEETGFEEKDLLPRLGGPGGRGDADRAVRAVVAEYREACGACRYRRLCGFAPVAYQIERNREGEEVRHAHHRVLKAGVAKLEKIPGWHKALLAILAEREKDALLAGCLLATAWAKTPHKMARLIEYTAARCDVPTLREEARHEKGKIVSDEDDGDDDDSADEGDDDDDGPGRKPPGLGAIDPEKLRARMFRGQVLRAVCFGRSADELRRIKDLLVLASDEEGRLFQYEAVAALTLLVAVRRPGDRWIQELESKALSPFRATFGARDAGGGAIDVFFPYRRGKRRSYIYFRRDKGGGESLASIDKIRTDSLLYRSFLVFDTDEKKTWRVFKELCRHLNVRAGQMNADHVLAGFERLEKDGLLLLGLYAPALARAVGHFVGVEDYHHLVKFLYKLRAESGRRGGPRVAAHEKVAEARDEWRKLRGAIGDDFIKEVFAVIFRLNASYVKASYTTDTYIKIGEVAYLLTAAAGWNPRGLEMELKNAKKALALIAYGLQPPDKWSKIRVGKLSRTKDRISGNHELERALEVGEKYMAAGHGYESFAELEEAASSGTLPEGGAQPPNAAAQDLSVDSESGRDELEASANDIPSRDPDADDTNVDMDAPELPPPKRTVARDLPPPPKAEPKTKGLVGTRNLTFDGDDDDDAPPRKGKGPAKKPGKGKPPRDDDD